MSNQPDPATATDFEVFVSALKSPDPNQAPAVPHIISEEGESASIVIPLPNCPDDAEAKLILKFAKGELIAADIDKFPPDPPEPGCKDQLGYLLSSIEHGGYLCRDLPEHEIRTPRPVAVE